MESEAPTKSPGFVGNWTLHRKPTKVRQLDIIYSDKCLLNVLLDAKMITVKLLPETERIYKRYKIRSVSHVN